MNFVFLNPWLLLGLTGAAAPFLIHLINRRRARRRPFAAMEFLLRSTKRLARRAKLKQLLLLLVRTTLVILLALAMACPVYSYLRKSAAGRPARSVVIVMDCSASMQRRTRDGTIQQIARRKAKEIVEGLKETDDAAIVACAAKAKMLTPGLVSERKILIDALAKVKPTFLAGTLEDGLAAALTLLKESVRQDRRVYVLSDMAEHAWRACDFERLMGLMTDAKASLVLVDLVGSEPAANVAITDLTVRQAADLEDSIEAQVQVQNFSGERRSVVVQVATEAGQSARATVDLPPGTASSRTLYLPEMGNPIVKCTASIGADALAVDNKRFAALLPSVSSRVLVVDGAPGAAAYEDEVFYLVRALRPDLSTSARILPRVVAPEEMAAFDLAPYDVIFLCNVAELPSTALANLRSAVRSGKGLFITVGDNVSPETYDAEFGELLPLRLKEIQKVGRTEALSFGALDDAHPIIAGLGTEGKTALKSPSFWTTFLPRTEGSNRPRIIASFTNGAPALVESAFGKGTVILFLSTIDRDWTDFPIHTCYLPLIHEIVKYLSTRESRRVGREVLVGTPISVALPPGAMSATVLRPDGASHVVTGTEGSKKQVVVSYDGMNVPGFYTFRFATGREQDKLIFPVNVDPSESDLKKVDEDRLRAQFGPTAVVFRKGGAEVSGDQAEKPLWPFFLLAAMIVLAIESVLAAHL